METKTETKPRVAKPKPRTVKISDLLHHRIRVLSVQKRIPMQEFIENLLSVGLRDKVYEQFSSAGDGQKTRTAAAT